MIDSRVRKELGVKKALQAKAKVSEGYDSDDIDFRHR